MWRVAAFLVLALGVAATGAAVAEGPEPPPCRASEHRCLHGGCIALDRFCDGLDDCGDKSDEPKYCSPCNRTFFGDVGRTYELEIRRPREDRLPFLCHLNFTAGGGTLGDLVQLTFDTFTVGKFVSFTSGGCPDGHMSIKEQNRPNTGGRWCGSAWGYTVYYSETPSLNLSLQLDRLSQQLTFDTFTVGKFVSFTSGGCPDGHMSIKEQNRPNTGGRWCGSAWGYTVYYSETPSLNLSLQLDRLSQQLTFDTFTVGKFVSFTSGGCPDGHMSIKEQNRPNTGGRWCGSAWGYTVYYSETPSLNLSLQLDRLSQQLTFDTFTVGKFVSFTSGGCPDGHMSIKEQNRPNTGGRWCGSAWGYTVYYSETPSLNLSLQLDRLSQQGIGYNFDFKLSYKFLRRSEARLRYGNGSLSTWRGDLQPGTYCDRVLEDCAKRTCRIQSPNYPGVYPRNVTCRYRIRERRPPPGKHAMLAVRQTNSHKIHIKDQIVKYDRSQRVLRVWDQCNVVQDYLTVFDGNDADSPILVRLCGGDAVPEIVSSGPHMLLEFHTSPYDNPFHPVPLSYLPGFELEVQVIYVDIDSHSFVREPHKCEFLLTTFDAPSGVLENPRHSLPPNTTCRYHFQGRAHEVVWLSFVKYHAASADAAAYDVTECSAQLRVWDGRVGGDVNARKTNVTILGEFCKDESPRLCDHTLLSNRTRATRPCSMAESYVSSGPEMTIEHFVRQGSALYPVSFVLKYEFVDVSQDGNPAQSSSVCDRVFRGHKGRVTSPRSTFLYGRGGQQNISCTYRFEANSGDRVKLVFNKLAFGDKECYSRRDPRSGRWRCDRYKPKIPGIAQITVGEYPWPGIYLPRDCICTNTTEPLIITTLTAQTVIINFTVTLMNITQDFKDFYFEAEYEFLSVDSDAICASAWGERRLRGSSGEIALRSPDSAFVDSDEAPVDSVRSASAPSDQCVHQPWLIEPEDSINNYLYLKIRGYELSPIVSCPTSNRIMVYSARNPNLAKTICPAVTEPGAGQVEVFSEGWSKPPQAAELLTEHSRSFIVEFLQKEAGNYMVTWIEVSKRPVVTSSSSFTMTGPADCPYRCPELNACISSSLWCDGLSHCPSGYDEQESNCSFQFGLPVIYILTGAACLAFLAFLIALTACIRCCQHRRREKKKMLAQLANRNNHLHINHLHHSNLGDSRALRYHPTTEDLFLDGKDSLC